MTARPRSAMNDVECPSVTAGGTTTCTAGSRPQSTSPPSDTTLWHAVVVGPGTSTPHRSVTAAPGSPQAAVAWLVVPTFGRSSPSESGSASTTSAHSGFWASSATGTPMRGAHAAVAATTPRSAGTARARTSRRRDGRDDPGGRVSETPSSVRDVPEEALLARIFPSSPTAPSTLVGPGDDCAVVAAPDGRYVVSTDVLVEDRHFRRRWSTGYDVGRRAAVQNLADVVSMGARPAALVVSLVMPGDSPVDWVTGFARGSADACTPLGAAVVGGDSSGGDQVVVAVTVHGDSEGREPVSRGGARAGDVVALAGTLGRSAAGLASLDAGRADVDDALVAAYSRPDPPLAAGPVAADAGATAMMDVSDGSSRDAGRVARASGVVVDSDPGALDADRARSRDAGAALAGEDDGAELVDGWVSSGGEDHGSLATFPAAAPLPAGFRRLGTVRPAGDDGAGVRSDGAVPRRSSGWDHFRA
ncbi:hypothetical protein OY671_000530 [Metschnikowia pulcherrima]|nr:hypothetical protein OY671_000530 [Metschnikowia pulcherrima]